MHHARVRTKRGRDSDSGEERVQKQKRSLTQRVDAEVASASAQEKQSSKKNGDETKKIFKVKFDTHMSDPKTKHHKMKTKEEYERLLDVVSSSCANSCDCAHNHPFLRTII